MMHLNTSLKEMVSTVIVVLVRVFMVIARDGLIDVVLVVVVRSDVVSVIELVVELGMGHVISFLLVDIVDGRVMVVGVVSTGIDGLVLRLLVELVIDVVWLRIGSVMVLKRCRFTPYMMGCHHTILTLLSIVMTFVAVRVTMVLTIVIVIARDGLIDVVLVVVVRSDVVSVIELVVELGMGHVISFLLVDIVDGRVMVVGVVSTGIDGLVVRLLMQLMVNIMWLSVGSMMVLEGCSLASHMVCSDHAVFLLLSVIVLMVIALMALLVIRVIIVVAGDGMVDSMLMISIGCHIMCIVVGMVQRVVRLMIS